MNILTFLLLLLMATVFGFALWRVPARALIYTVSGLLLLVAVGLFILNSNADLSGGQSAA